MNLIFLIFAISAIAPLARAAGEEKKRSDAIKEILTSLLLNKYHSYVRPEKNVNGTTDESAEPLEIYVSMYIINIDIDTKNQECELLMYFRQGWDDRRSVFEPKDGVNELSLNDATGFWTPDLFFVTEKTGHLHQVTKQNSFFRVFPNGETLYSQRPVDFFIDTVIETIYWRQINMPNYNIEQKSLSDRYMEQFGRYDKSYDNSFFEVSSLTLSVKAPCRMDLRKYPFDRQTCTLAVESYGYTADDIILKRKDDKMEDGSGEPSEFHVSYSISEKAVQIGKKYSRLELEINMKRVPYAQIFHVYLPLGFLVILSWISFWIRPSSHLPRLTATALTVLTALSVLQMTREFFYLQKYLTALDIWTGFSLFLIFGAFLETIYVVGIRRDVKPKTPTTDGVMNQKEVPEMPSSGKGDGKVKIIVSGLALKDSNPDEIAKIAFPVSFLLFVFMYSIYVFI